MKPKRIPQRRYDWIKIQIRKKGTEWQAKDGEELWREKRSWGGLINDQSRL